MEEDTAKDIVVDCFCGMGLKQRNRVTLFFGYQAHEDRSSHPVDELMAIP
jgi:hypothetical protein